MELGPQNQNGDGLLGANSIIVVYMDPLGIYNIYIHTYIYIGTRRHKASTLTNDSDHCGRVLPTAP